MSTFLDGLNPQQKKAVEQLSGPLLILAGAGSGKTRVLTYRLANLIIQGEATPGQILCVTFTNKAAKEMRTRSEKLLRECGIPIYENLWISTFHSICVRILREHIHILGFSNRFTIYDQSDQLSLIKKTLTLLNINDKVYPAKQFQSYINEAKTLGYSSKDIEKRYDTFGNEKFLDVYKTYEQQLFNSQSLDFSDLLLKTLELFKNHPEVLEFYVSKFQYIMVDEYQDTNKIQYKIVNLLAQAHRNLCVVGDEDQSIYSWRGADIQNILRFEKDYKEAVVIKLEQNYRSSQNIVNAASKLIAHNTQRNDKVLFTENDEGDLIHLAGLDDEYAEAKYVIGKVKDLLTSGEVSPKDVSIFYRTNAQSRALEEQLRFQSINYKIVGGLKFYDRKEIKDIISYMKLINNPDDDIAFKRVINVPTRGIGKVSMTKLEDYAHTQNLSLYKAVPGALGQKLYNAGTSKKITGFYNLLVNLQETAANCSLEETYHAIIDGTKYINTLKQEGTTESYSRIENLEEFNNVISHFINERAEEATLQNFLEEIALISDVDKMDSEEQTVTLMTLHISKGLEYPFVFIVGLEDGLFPSSQSEDNEDPFAIEEERRLFYVGMTRAMTKLHLSYAKSRRVWGNTMFHKPSRFLSEIPQEYLDRQVLLKTHSNLYNKYADNVPKPTDEFFDFEPNYDDNEDGFKKGMKVRHPSFGVGSITSLEGSGDDQKISVAFSGKRIKKFVAKYAKLEKINQPYF